MIMQHNKDLPIDETRLMHTCTLIRTNLDHGTTKRKKSVLLQRGLSVRISRLVTSNTR